MGHVWTYTDRHEILNFPPKFLLCTDDEKRIVTTYELEILKVLNKRGWNEKLGE